MSNRERVLVVDEISDTAEVLQAVLEPRGVTVHRVSRWSQTESPTVENRPAVVVYDAESLADGALPPDENWHGGNWHGVPQIIIGTIRPGKFETGKFETGKFETGKFETGKFETGKFDTGKFDGAKSDTKEPAAPEVERRYLQKPFQFAELVQAIEALIASRAKEQAHAV